MRYCDQVVAGDASTCCGLAEAATCIRRAAPMPGCGTSPSPPISLEVSTITTRLPRSSASILQTPDRHHRHHPRRRRACAKLSSGLQGVVHLCSKWPVEMGAVRQATPRHQVVGCASEVGMHAKAAEGGAVHQPAELSDSCGLSNAWTSQHQERSAFSGQVDGHVCTAWVSRHTRNQLGQLGRSTAL